MLWILTKNYFKLAMRSKWILAFMILGPIIVIAALSSALGKSMKTEVQQGTIEVGYCIEENTKFASYIEPLKQLGKEMKIEWIQSDLKKAEEMIETGDLTVFVEFRAEDYTIYEGKNGKFQAGIVKNLLYQMSRNEGTSIEVPTEQVEFIRVPEANEYYGKVEIIYFLWCGMMVLSTVINSERKNRIHQRLMLAPVNNITLYLSKFIPSVLLLNVITFLSATISSILFDIHWGCYLKAIGIFFVGTLAVSSFGLLFFYLISNLAVAVIGEFVVIWILGFLGGSFECYLYASYPQKLVNLSPIYHMNRALVEYETMGSSQYGITTVVFYISIAVVCSILGSLIMKRRIQEG